MANQEPCLQFLVIGGYAVAAHGHSRMTFDVDFLGRQTERQAWLRRTAACGLRKASESSAFAQFSQVDGDGFDLMFVNNETFDQLWAASVEKDFSGHLARTPSLDHLLALKLHALKQKLPHRTAKDAEDVQLLIQRNGLDISQQRYQDLFLKYGTREIYNTFVRILKH